MKSVSYQLWTILNIPRAILNMNMALLRTISNILRAMLNMNMTLLRTILNTPRAMLNKTLLRGASANCKPYYVQLLDRHIHSVASVAPLSSPSTTSFLPLWPLWAKCFAGLEGIDSMQLKPDWSSSSFLIIIDHQWSICWLMMMAIKIGKDCLSVFCTQCMYSIHCLHVKQFRKQISCREWRYRDSHSSWCEKWKSKSITFALKQRGISNQLLNQQQLVLDTGLSRKYSRINVPKFQISFWLQ